MLIDLELIKQQQNSAKKSICLSIHPALIKISELTLAKLRIGFMYSRNDRYEA